MADTSATYSRRRQLKYAMRTIEQWFDGAKLAKKDADETTLRPPSVPDWKKLGPIMTKFYQDVGYESDGDDDELDGIDGDDSEPEDEFKRCSRGFQNAGSAECLRT